MPNFFHKPTTNLFLTKSKESIVFSGITDEFAFEKGDVEYGSIVINEL
jgi:hypothetical protein